MFCPKCGTENPDHGKFCRKCGITLAAISTAVGGNAFKLPELCVDDRAGKSNNPDDLWSAGIKTAIMGVGFLIVSIVLFSTNVAGGKAWWWAMLFPAFSMLAGGISSIAKAKRIEQKTAVNFSVSAGGGAGQNQFGQTPVTNALPPPTQTEYVSPAATESRYKTGDLVASSQPPSVIEATTRQLDMNSEGETMTLPKK